jgi:hypothetical protein
MTGLYDAIPNPKTELEKLCTQLMHN